MYRLEEENAATSYMGREWAPRRSDTEHAWTKKSLPEYHGSCSSSMSNYNKYENEKIERREWKDGMDYRCGNL